MKAGTKRRFGFAAGVVSLIVASGNLAIFYWVDWFSFLFLGPIALCAALIAFAHGSWRIACVAGFLSICSSVLAATARRPFYSWQLVLLCGSIATACLLAWWLWAKYRKVRTIKTRRLLATWLAGIQRGLGPLLGAASLAMGLIVWLEFDLAYCSAFGGHLTEAFETFAPNGMEVALLSSSAFLTGVTAIGCGAWRLGTLATHVSVGALVALNHVLYSTQVFEIVLLTAPLALLYQPFTLAPLHPLYNPWIAAILAATLFVTWIVGGRRRHTRG